MAAKQKVKQNLGGLLDYIERLEKERARLQAQVWALEDQLKREVRVCEVEVELTRRFFTHRIEAIEAAMKPSNN